MVKAGTEGREDGEAEIHGGRDRDGAAAGGGGGGERQTNPAACHESGIAEQTYYRWRNEFGGLKADDAKQLKDLERENVTLKRLLADAELEKAALKEIARGNF